MALTPSGRISMGGDEPDRSINVELGKNPTDLITLNDADARELAGVPSGIISLSDFYGKSSGPDYLPCGWVPTAEDMVMVFHQGDGDMWDDSFITFPVGTTGGACCLSNGSPTDFYDFNTFPPTYYGASSPPFNFYPFSTGDGCVSGEDESLLTYNSMNDGNCRRLLAIRNGNDISYTTYTDVYGYGYGAKRITSGEGRFFAIPFLDEGGGTRIELFDIARDGIFTQGATLVLSYYMGFVPSHNDHELFGLTINPDETLSVRKVNTDSSMSVINVSDAGTSPNSIGHGQTSIGCHIPETDTFLHLTYNASENPQVFIQAFSDEDPPVYKGYYLLQFNQGEIYGLFNLYRTADPDCLLFSTYYYSESSGGTYFITTYTLTLSDGVPVSVTQHAPISYLMPLFSGFFPDDCPKGDFIFQKSGVPHLPIVAFGYGFTIDSGSMSGAISLRVPTA